MDIGKIGVVGAGTMGNGIAQTFAIARCVSGNPNGSLILQKPALAGTTHAGGKPWAQATNPTAFTAATNWINGGCAP